MLSYQKGVVKTSVRHLVEFLFRGGDITTGSSVSASPEAMLEGSRLHRKIQRGQKATYQSEVPLKMEWQEERYDLVLEGRADGIDKTEVNKDRLSDVDGMNQIESNEEKLTYVDEIKCVYRDVEEIEEADILHLAQAKCYAYMYGAKQDLEKIGVQITYCHLETEQIKRIFYCYTMGELSLWFAEVLDAYRMWAAYYVEAREKRNASIQALQFPFSFRPGQKKMTAIAYQAMENKKHIFLQAPTGVGKTISTLYPALKELGAEKAENIFYLTAKTITRTVAEDTIKLLKKQGLFLSAVTITAKFVFRKRCSVIRKVVREQKDILTGLTRHCMHCLLQSARSAGRIFFYLLKNIRFVHMNCLLRQRCGRTVLFVIIIMYLTRM